MKSFRRRCVRTRVFHGFINLNILTAREKKPIFYASCRLRTKYNKTLSLSIYIYKCVCVCVYVQHT